VGQYRVGSWTVETLPEAIAVAFAGIVFVALNLLNGFASLQARYTAALLSDRDAWQVVPRRPSSDLVFFSSP